MPEWWSGDLLATVPEGISLRGRVPRRLDDAPTVRSQFAEEDLEPPQPTFLQNDISTDVIAPVRVCLHFDDVLGEVTITPIDRNSPGGSGPQKVYLASPATVAASAYIAQLVSWPRLRHLVETGVSAIRDSIRQESRAGGHGSSLTYSGQTGRDSSPWRPQRRGRTWHGPCSILRG